MQAVQPVQAVQPPKTKNPPSISIEEENTHSQCVLPNSKLQATCKQVNSQKQHTLTVCIPQCRDARLERPIGRQTKQSR